MLFSQAGKVVDCSFGVHDILTRFKLGWATHCIGVMMGEMAAQITSLLNRLFRSSWTKTSKLRVTGFRAGNSPVTDKFPHKWPVTRKMLPFDDVIMIVTQ